MNLPNLSLMEGMDCLGKEVDDLRKRVTTYKLYVIVALVSVLALGIVSINQSQRIADLELTVIGLASATQARGDSLQDMIEKSNSAREELSSELTSTVSNLTSTLENYRSETEKRDLMLWKAIKHKK